jgi:hypothetical protein
MTKTWMFWSLCAVLLLSLTPTLFAQDRAEGTVMQFKTPMAFYVGNAKMPAGSYQITQPATGQSGVLKIKNAAGTHESFLDADPITSIGTHQAGDVVFDKVGYLEFLEEFYLPAGSSSFGSAVGFKVLESKAEKAAEAAGSKTSHTISGSK